MTYGEQTTTSTTYEDDSHSSKTSPSATQPEPPVCPDGGWKAWLTVGGAFAGLFCTFGQLNAFGTFQTWYAEHQLHDLPPSTIAWIGSLQLWIFFFSGGFVGRLFDAHGPRVIMIPGTVMLVLSVMMTSLSTRFYQYILAQGVLFGVGVGMIFYPSLSAISTHFSKRRGTAVGIAFAGSGVGGVVYPIMFQRLFVEVGFPWAVRISGFISLACCAVAIATVTSRREPVRHQAPWIDGKIFQDVPFMLAVAGSVFVCLGMTTGISATTAFYVLSAMNGGGIVGRLAPPLVSDFIGPFNIIVPCAFLLGLSPLVFWIFAKSLVAILLFAILYGFLSGGFIAILIPCVAQISEPNEIGTRIGVLYSIVSFGALAGGPAAGALLKADHDSYAGLIALCGVANILGSFFMLWSRIRLAPLWARI
ncbi:MFS general substrate transporter [Ganoderma leucocontextum]|nr:MFS general substrate transporter [Ganoderma leucocontextum]